MVALPTTQREISVDSVFLWVALTSDRTVSHLILCWQDFDVLNSLVSVPHPLYQMMDQSVVKPLNHICTEVLAVKTEVSTEIKGE